MPTPTPITIDGLPTLTINGLNTYSGTFDAVNDLFVVYQKSGSSTVNINRNTVLNLASAPVGLTDTQTLTNKTLTSPTISGPTLSGTLVGTYTIGGTPTFPASVVSLTGTQTLTNKTLTSPTINSPTITNATVSADSITGYTASTNGTLYGISIVGSVITSAAVGSTSIATNAVQAANLATNAIYLGSTTITSTFTTTNGSATQVTGLSVTVTIPSGARKVEVSVKCSMGISTGGQVTLTLWDGVVGSGTNLDTSFFNSTGVQTSPATLLSVVSPSAGSKTYNVGFATSAGTGSLYAGSTYPAIIEVKVI